MQQGLGQIGNQPQGQPQKEEFTIGTAAMLDEEGLARAKGRGQGGPGRGLGQVNQQAMPVQPQQQQPKGNPELDKSAIDAVEAGQVPIATVMQDPAISDTAKQYLQQLS